MRRHIGVGGSLPAQWPVYVETDLLAHGIAWPLQLVDTDGGADDHIRSVELHHDRLVMRRRVAGTPMRLELPLADYAGIAVRLLDPYGDDEGISLVLEHEDPALAVTLYSAGHADDVVAQWRRWSAELGRPMLMTHADGRLEPAYPMLGRLTVAEDKPRRRRRGALKGRRPTVYRRRAAGRPLTGQAVHRGECELFARD